MGSPAVGRLALAAALLCLARTEAKAEEAAFPFAYGKDGEYAARWRSVETAAPVSEGPDEPGSNPKPRWTTYSATISARGAATAGGVPSVVATLGISTVLDETNANNDDAPPFPDPTQPLAAVTNPGTGLQGEWTIVICNVMGYTGYGDMYEIWYDEGEKKASCFHEPVCPLEGGECDAPDYRSAVCSEVDGSAQPLEFEYFHMLGCSAATNCSRIDGAPSMQDGVRSMHISRLLYDLEDLSDPPLVVILDAPYNSTGLKGVQLGILTQASMDDPMTALSMSNSLADMQTGVDTAATQMLTVPPLCRTGAGGAAPSPPRRRLAGRRAWRSVRRSP